MAKWAGTEYTDQRESIEWVYLGLARYLRQAGWQAIGGTAQWFPWWYNGVPVENTYPPLLHYLTALWMKVGHLSAGAAYHGSTAFFYCLGGGGVYALSLRWTKSIASSLTAACAYSLFAPCSWLMPSIAGDLNGYWLNQRLSVLCRYGEGPHVASLALLPWALLALDRLAEQPTWRRAAVAAVACAAVPLANIIGGFALAWGALAILAARGGKALVPVAGVGLWAYLLALRWLNPWMLDDIRRNASFVGGSYPMDGGRYALLGFLAAVTIGIMFWLRRWPAGARVAAALGFALPMSVIPLLWEYRQFHLLPQPHRYHLEMDLALALLLAWALAELPARVRPWLCTTAVAGLIVFAATNGRAIDRYIQPLSLKDAWEFRIVRWMANHDPDARVYFQGTPRFFAGLERNQMQFGGGFSNGLRLPLFFLIDYGIGAGEDSGAETLLWLHALGIDYVAVGDDNTQNLFRPWKKPGKFDAHLTTVWQEGGDRILEVRRRNESLAHVIPAEALVRRAPVHFYDLDPIRRYVEALEGPAGNGGVLRWLDPSTAEIEAEFRPGDALSIQIAYDPRWHAIAPSGQRLAVAADALGQIIITPAVPGLMKIRLEFRNPPMLFVLWVTAWLLLLGALCRFQLPFSRNP